MAAAVLSVLINTALAQEGESVEFTLKNTGDPLKDYNPARHWTTSDNRQVKAVILGVDGNTAVMRQQDGKVIKLPLERLSSNDQRFCDRMGGAF